MDAARFSALALLCPLLACGASPKAAPAEPVVVWVGQDEALEDALIEALAETARVAGGEDAAGCAFLWGDVALSRAEARPARFAWAGGREGLDGYILCGDDARRAMRDPRIQDRATLFYAEGELRIARPGVGSTTYETGSMDEGVAAKPAMAVFEGDTSDADARAAEVLEELSGVTGDFMFLVWPLR